MLWHKTKPLLHCEVLHHLPGRVRIGCRALRYLAAQSKEICQRLEDLVPVRVARLSAVTENVLVFYDSSEATLEDIVEQTETVLGGYSLLAYKAERAVQDSVTVNERRLQEEPISEMLVRIGVTTATLGYPLVSKRAMKVPATMLGRFLITSRADGSVARPAHPPQRLELALRPWKAECGYAERHGDPREHSCGPRLVGPDHHLAGRHRGAADRVHHGPDASGDPRHALSRRRRRVAHPRRRDRGAGRAGGACRGRPDHGPHRREDQRRRRGYLGRGRRRPGFDYRRVHAAAKSGGRRGLRRNHREERPGRGTCPEGRRPDRRRENRSPGRGGDTPQGHGAEHRGSHSPHN